MTVISFQHNFIFIKTAKTAGTSIEVNLSAVAGDDAIVTPIIPPEPGHVPRNHSGPDGTVLFYNHMSAAEIRARLGAQRFDGMFKFCVEREPVEKCISYFHMLRNSQAHNADGANRFDWDEFLARGELPTDVNRYAIDGRCAVDRILRYDALPGALEDLMAGLGVPSFRLTARAKSHYRDTCLIRPEDVTAAQRALIYDHFEEALSVSGIDWRQPPAVSGPVPDAATDARPTDVEGER